MLYVNSDLEASIMNSIIRFLSLELFCCWFRKGIYNCPVTMSVGFFLWFVLLPTCVASLDNMPIRDVASDRMSIANMTCHFFEQPLNHFVPRGRSPAYLERYCTYDEFADRHDNKSPIFFYTGNESPLEQYINQVGYSVYIVVCNMKRKFCAKNSP